MKPKLHAFIYRLHKYFAIIVGVQLFLWVLSGLYMTAVPIEYVHGDHLRKEAQQSFISANEVTQTLSSIKLHLSEQTIISIEILSRLGKPTYFIKTANENFLIDAKTQTIVPELSPKNAALIAQQAYTGEAKILSTARITHYEQAPEIKGKPLPLWQVNFDDWINTSLYVSHKEAQVISARSDIWRIFDFLWMLHIMDYEDRSDFNNPLVIFMASAGILMALSGVILIINGFKRAGLRFIK